MHRPRDLPLGPHPAVPPVALSAGEMESSLRLAVRQVGLGSPLHVFLAVCPQTKDVTSLSLSLLSWESSARSGA